MLPILKRFSEHRPRTYGVILLMVAFGSAMFWQKGAAWTFVFICLSVAFGLSGILYLFLGSKYGAWDVKFEAVLSGANISWRQAIFSVGLGVALLAIAFWIFFSL